MKYGGIKKMNKTTEIFISRLDQARKEKGLTQRELADRVGVTEVSMSRYINGARVPSGPIVVNIAKALGISVDYLVGTSNVKKRQTNADRIRNMSDEELAEFMRKMEYNCFVDFIGYTDKGCGRNEISCKDCRAKAPTILDWLQSEAE